MLFIVKGVRLIVLFQSTKSKKKSVACEVDDDSSDGSEQIKIFNNSDDSDGEFGS